MNIEQYLKSLDVWSWIVLTFVVLAIALTAWKLVPPLGRLISKPWARILKKKNNLNRGEILATSIFLGILIIAGIVCMPIFLPLKGLWYWLLVIPLVLLAIVAMLVIIFLIIYFWWAPNNLYFTFIPEGTGKDIVRSDQFKEAIINWQEHVLVKPKNKGQYPDKDLWDVVEGDPPKRMFGGLYFYGWWPVDDVYIYPFTWTSVGENGAKIEHKEEILDYVMLKEDIYLCIVSKAEDKLLLPTDIEVILPIRIINPYKSQFNVQDWLEAVLNRVRAAVRNAYTQHSYAEWISSEKDLGKEIYRRLEEKVDKHGEPSDDGQSFLVDECEDKYGIKVRAADVISVNPGDKFREATLKGFLGQKEAERFAGEISYAVLGVMALGRGISIDKMQEEINKDESGKLLTKYTNFCLKRFTEKMAAESGSWVRIDTSGSTGMKKDFLELIASAIRMPQGKKQSKTEQNKPAEKQEEKQSETKQDKPAKKQD
ncbi:hypothetical protein AMJ47_03375 [Parcubacteria bacterium DG_72]|nr:MAG: hypothetical protein AMJ47_03375 [Parcubacteria bacterium DG_72]